MRQLLSHFLVILMFLGTFSTVNAQDGGKTGQPVPRYISVDTDKAYMRTGPGRQYPIIWVYKRRNLPVKVIDEYGPWRQVSDHEGVIGWMHVSLLDGRRTAIIVDGTETMRSENSITASIIAKLGEGVIVLVDACEDSWCKVTHKDPSITGWIPRGALFGVFPDEVIE